MNTIKLIFSIIAFSTISLIGLSQESVGKKTDTVEIQTSAQCSMCKDRIEKDMAYTKGVKSVSLDLETKIVTIEYRTEKTNPEKLKMAINKIGYDADDNPADLVAYEKLPDCCKKGGHDNDK